MSHYKTFATYSHEGKTYNNIQNGVSKVHRITSSTERTKLIKNNNVVVIDNYTDWCHPCKELEPKFSLLADKLSLNSICAFGKENVEDELGGLPEQINGVPCFHFYVNGEFQPEMVISGADIESVEITLTNLLS